MPMASSASSFAHGLLPVEIPEGADLVRVHWQSNGPVFFGPRPGSPAGNRFDAPAGEYRVLYAAAELPGAFVETVLRRPGRVMRRSEADERAATRLEVRRSLRLAKVFDEGLQWHGIDAGDVSTDDYASSRRLALDFHREFPTLDGLAYRSRYDNGQICYALFDRVKASDLASTTRLDLDKYPVLVDDLMKRYGAVFDTSGPL